MKYLIIVLSLLVTGCTTTNKVSEQQAINQFTVSQNYPGLIEFYKKKVIDDKNDWQAQQDLAQAYLSYGDLESADFYIQRVLSLAPSPSETAYFIKGQVLARNLDFNSALVKYKQAIDNGLNSAELYMQQGIALAQTKQYAMAIDSFNKARLRGYDDVSIKNNIAMVHIYQRDYQSAIDILLPLYEKDSSNETVNANLEISMLKQKKEKQGENSSLVTDTVSVDENADSFVVPSKSDVVSDEVEVTTISAEEFFTAQSVEQKPQTEPVKKSATKSKRTYHIQLGAYDTMAEALEKRNGLLSTQLPITIRPVELKNSETWYRLLSGNFASYRQAMSFAKQHQDVLNPHEYFIQVTR
ncbi:TadD protein [Vibrio halioticoli NBRC 102217]|uniref:TadD protein n=1 Tax=Vibrio halioticoli NBRC 102217 TaxID=1219072 RepID=V5FH27_9VIBR|nr:SPOR domain-containing protein [Vibrio halioticoli]GAD88342.1 TadD protein [Vibrio halioticoli NBRC 102217]